MTARARRQAVIAPAPTADHGHAFIRRGGRLQATQIGAADDIELMEIADLTRPEQRGAMVRVARRIDPLIVLLDIRHDGPGRQQFLAAEQLRNDSAVAEGRSLTGGDLAGTVHGISGSPEGPTHRALAAQARVRLAWLAVRGPTNDVLVADVVRLVVLGWQPLVRVCNHFGWHDKGRRAHTWLDCGLTRLVAHFGLD